MCFLYYIFFNQYYMTVRANVHIVIQEWMTAECSKALPCFTLFHFYSFRLVRKRSCLTEKIICSSVYFTVFTSLSSNDMNVLYWCWRWKQWVYSKVYCQVCPWVHKWQSCQLVPLSTHKNFETKETFVWMSLMRILKILCKLEHALKMFHLVSDKNTWF